MSRHGRPLALIAILRPEMRGLIRDLVLAPPAPDVTATAPAPLSAPASESAPAGPAPASTAPR